LARPARDISLADVYRAVRDAQNVIPIHPSPNPRCPVGRHVQAVLQRRFDAAERALAAELDRTTIADLAGDIARRGAR
jgi:DNA-binding IscR family transcriptional regulator